MRAVHILPEMENLTGLVIGPRQITGNRSESECFTLKEGEGQGSVNSSERNGSANVWQVLQLWGCPALLRCCASETIRMCRTYAITRICTLII